MRDSFDFDIDYEIEKRQHPENFREDFTQDVEERAYDYSQR